jgi:PatG C-terminal
MQENSVDESSQVNNGYTNSESSDLQQSAQSNVNQGQMQEDKPCGCGANKPSMLDRNFVYALGRIQPRFPSRSIEKEYYQVIGRTETSGQTDYEAMRTALSQRQNRYLVRQICWIFSIEGIETYILKPVDPADFDLLVESLRAPPRGTDLDVIIGYRGFMAEPEMCNGLVVPIVAFEQIYSFDVDTLMKSLPKKEKTRRDYTTKSEEVLYRIMQMADNVGATDEHRCLNYLAVRYPAYYEKTAEMHENDYSLTRIDVRPSRLTGVEKIMDCIFTYTNRKTDVDEKWYCRVSLSGLFPHLVTKLSPYYDR